MASAEREAIPGVWGRSPQRGPGAEPLVRGSGGRSPPEAESILSFTSANGAQICQFLLPCKLLKYGFWRPFVKRFVLLLDPLSVCLSCL